MHRQSCRQILFGLIFPSSWLWIQSQSGVSSPHFPGSLTLSCILNHRNRILSRTSRYCWRSWSAAPGQQILKWSNSFENTFRELFRTKTKKSMGDRRLPVTIFRVFWLNRPWLTFVRSDWVYTFRWRRLGLKIMVFWSKKSSSVPWAPLQASKSIQFCLPVSGVGPLNRP